MKILLFNTPYKIYVNPCNPCKKCILDRNGMCPKVPTAICIEYGGFQPSDTKIFTL